MTELTTYEDASALQAEQEAQLPTQFRPEGAFERQSKADAIVAFAKRMKDWPMLESATDQKLDELQELVGWWDANVGVRQSPGTNQHERSVPDRGLTTNDAEDLTGFTKQQVSKIRKKLKNRPKFREQILGAAYKKAMDEAVNMRIAENTGDDEWYTPPEYIEAAREVLGEIDLDAASCEFVQETVQAKRFFSQDDDALKKDWHGRVWLNPPYSRALIPQFVEKLVSEHVSGNTTEAVLLTHNYTDTGWFHCAISAASAVCFTKGRIHFVQADGERNSPTNGQAFCYFGPNPDRFAEVFSNFGFVAMPWQP